MEIVVSSRRQQGEAGYLRSRLALVHPDGSSTDELSSEEAIPSSAPSSAALLKTSPRRQRQQQQQQQHARDEEHSYNGAHQQADELNDDDDDDDDSEEEDIPTFDYPLHPDLEGTPAVFYRGPLTSEEVLQLLTQTTPAPLSRQARNALTPSNTSITRPPIGSPWAWFHFRGLFPRPVAHRKGPKRRRLHDTTTAATDSFEFSNHDDEHQDESEEVLFERWQCKSCKTNCHVPPKRYSNLSAHLYGHARQVGCLAKRTRRRWVPGAPAVERLPHWSEHDRKAVKDAERARAQLLAGQQSSSTTRQASVSAPATAVRKKEKVVVAAAPVTGLPAAHISEVDEESEAAPGPSSSSLPATVRNGNKRSFGQLANDNNQPQTKLDTNGNATSSGDDGHANGRNEKRAAGPNHDKDQGAKRAGDRFRPTMLFPHLHTSASAAAAGGLAINGTPSSSSNSPWSSESEYVPSSGAAMRGSSSAAVGPAPSSSSSSSSPAASSSPAPDRTHLIRGGRAVSGGVETRGEDQEAGSTNVRRSDAAPAPAPAVAISSFRVHGDSSPSSGASSSAVSAALGGQSRHHRVLAPSMRFMGPPSSRRPYASAAASNEAQRAILAVPRHQQRRRRPPPPTFPQVASNPCFVLASAHEPDYPILATSSSSRGAAEQGRSLTLEAICGYPAASSSPDEGEGEALVGVSLVDLLAVEDMILADQMVEDVLRAAGLEGGARAGAWGASTEPGPGKEGTGGDTDRPKGSAANVPPNEDRPDEELHLPPSWESTTYSHTAYKVLNPIRLRHAHGYFLPFCVRLHLVPLVPASSSSNGAADAHTKDQMGGVGARADASRGPPSSSSSRPHRRFALVWTFLLAGNPGAQMPSLLVAPKAQGQAENDKTDEEEDGERQRRQQQRHVELLQGAAVRLRLPELAR
ncbi:hypothetical protein OC846_003387 [Tilletia horrida]|uniref:Uncharacterized protein n=1 Tax=Tilletia horrida TaxID=155126 RepID=A0AAN6GQI5_9BASI|nr:hypothetical protein OC845_003212 [Tilletia horrida]KAK0551147.1 hypothetical protein OC846_003387 [Tilletia horrida]KAK0566120.1 hypothetical protein OC861_003414 [Tilletia horrida]